jgi:hypothetical protein
MQFGLKSHFFSTKLQSQTHPKTNSICPKNYTPRQKKKKKKKKKRKEKSANIE